MIFKDAPSLFIGQSPFVTAVAGVERHLPSISTKVSY